jgi:asparagine synthase (glutamine-hydrolysing)
VKPLYYVDRDGLLVFASEIKSLLRHPDMSAVLDQERLAEWLALRYTTAPGTLFRDVRKLEPGSYLRVDRSGVKQVRYWDVDLTPRKIGRDEALARYAELFRESVRLRMRADVPVGVFLSGGLDSSMVALEAAAATSRPIQTFTVGYRDNDHLSELSRARLVADHLGSEHHELTLDEVEPGILGDVVWHLEEPVGDPATVLLHRLAEFTRRNVTVVLSGEGSDETNLGYGRTSAFRRWSSLRERALVGSMLGRVWLKRNAPTALDRGWENVDEERIYAELTWGGAARRAALAGDSGDRWLRGLQGTLKYLPGNDRLSKLLYLDLKGWLTDDLLLKVDKTTMAYALEARVPFLDHKLVEFNLGLPAEWKINASGTKLFAREVVRGRLPESTVARSQHGFIAPLASWFSQGWQGMLDRSLGPDGLGSRRLFAPGLLNTIRADIHAGRSDSLMLGFMLMSLEHWFDRFDVQVEPLEAVRA